MRVLFVPLGSPLIAASRVRIYQYLPGLMRRGVVCRTVPFYTAAAEQRLCWHPQARALLSRVYSAIRAVQIAKIAERYDVVVWQRVLLPRIALRLLRRHSRRLLFDVDDALYAPEPMELRAGKAPTTRGRRFDEMARVSDAVIASTSAIAARAARSALRTHILPGPVDTRRFRPIARAPSHNVRIGWIGSPSTSIYLSPVLPTLRQMARRDSRLTIHIIGGAPMEHSERAELTAWSLATEARDIANLDIGIMPLAHDEWSAAKAGHKLLQYQACGVPSVATAVGVTEEIIEDGKTGLLVWSEQDWEPQLTRLIESPSLRHALGRAGRESVLQHYSLEAMEPRLIEILESAIGSRASRGATA